MTLTFANFKKIIPAQILTRGRTYVDNIIDLSFDEEEMVWEVQVEGTELYDVRVEQDSNGSLICTCTCPYDMGEYCKHVAAVLYSIEDNFPDQLTTKPRKKAAKRKTRHDKLREGLEKASREQLVSILLQMTQEDKELLNKLLLHLDEGGAKPTDFRRLVKDALRSGRGEYGYLDYSGSTRAGRKLGDLLNQADRWCEGEDVEKAVGMYQAVIDETIPVMGHADDSNGELGGCLNQATEGLAHSIERLGKTGRDALLTYCLEGSRKAEFRMWDWGWDLLKIAGELVQIAEQRALFTSTLEEIEAEVTKKSSSGSFNDYYLEKVVLLKFAMIERFDGKAASNAFLQANTHLHGIRKLLIQRCIDEGALDEAKDHIEAGIAASNRAGYGGLTVQYQALQVNLLQRTGDKSAVVKATRALWLSRGDVETFVSLKRSVPTAGWGAFVEGLIKDLERKPDQLAWLYAEENRWQDLLKMIQFPSPFGLGWLISTYQSELEKRFPDAMAAIYERMLGSLVERAMDRGDYKRIAALLRQMTKLGHGARATVLAEDIREQYPKRRALLDELSRL